MVSLLKRFVQAKAEGSQPQEPLQQGSQHDGPDDGDIYDLWLSAMKIRFERYVGTS